ncbi:MAG: hypothetical protein PVF05_05070 [Gemmatimonadales bacterium]|jgi:predicted metalloprotease with PDZ domain
MVRHGLGLVLAGSLLAACSADDTASTAPEAMPVYEISYEAGTPGRLRVTAHLPEAPARLTMSERGADQLSDGWAHFVENLAVSTEGGAPIAVEKAAGRAWRVEAAGEPPAPVVLTYDVRLVHDSVSWQGGVDGAAMALPWGAYFAGRAVFVTPDSMDGPVRVRFRPAPGRDAAASWPAATDGASHTFVAPSPASLTESYAFIGAFEGFTVERGGFELAFALGGPSVVARRDEFRALADSAFDYYVALMNGAPRPAPGEPAGRILVIINEANVTDGEVIGSDINILLEKNPDPFGRLFSTFGLVHELFHLWNGKSIRPAGPDDWFKEGLTNYYALKTLHRTGNLPEDVFFDLVGGMLYGRYVSDPGYGRLSPREALVDKDGHWGLVYGGGMFAGLCMDAEIRRASGGEQSLDDVMRAMFARFGGSADEYGLEDVATAVREAAGGGYDPGPFLDRHVRGAEPIPVAACLENFGLVVGESEGGLALSRPVNATAPATRRIDGLLGRLD